MTNGHSRRLLKNYNLLGLLTRTLAKLLAKLMGENSFIRYNGILH